jgi:hypothetical protein
MPGDFSSFKDGRDAILAWVTVFEKQQWSTGGFEIVVTLFNISSFKEYIDKAVENKLRAALKNSKMLEDREIMNDIKSARKNGKVPHEEWWWWPEKIK